MRRFVELVFDDFVVGTASAYSTPEADLLLGTPDRFAVHAVVDQVTGTSPTLTVQVEHGSDGRNWSSKSGTPEINVQSLSAAATNQFTGVESGASPSHTRVRLRVALGGTSPQAHVKLYVTGRDRP